IHTYKFVEFVHTGVFPVTSVSINNRHRSRAVNVRLLRQIVLRCLRELLKVPMYDVSIQIVDATEITRLNEKYLKHAGSTDVVTFAYEESPPIRRFIWGDIYVCIDEAIRQAKRFGTSWQQELVRYVVHGILHLLGYDDRTVRARKGMKSIENKLV